MFVDSGRNDGDEDADGMKSRSIFRVLRLWATVQGHLRGPRACQTLDLVCGFSLNTGRTGNGNERLGSREGSEGQKEGSWGMICLPARVYFKVGGALCRTSALSRVVKSDGGSTEGGWEEGGRLGPMETGAWKGF